MSTATLIWVNYNGTLWLARMLDVTREKEIVDEFVSTSAMMMTNNADDDESKQSNGDDHPEEKKKNPQKKKEKQEPEMDDLKRKVVGKDHTHIFVQYLEDGSVSLLCKNSSDNNNNDDDGNTKNGEKEIVVVESIDDDEEDEKKENLLHRKGSKNVNDASSYHLKEFYFTPEEVQLIPSEHLQTIAYVQQEIEVQKNAFEMLSSHLQATSVNVADDHEKTSSALKMKKRKRSEADLPQQEEIGGRELASRKHSRRGGNPEGGTTTTTSTASATVNPSTPQRSSSRVAANSNPYSSSTKSQLKPLVESCHPSPDRTTGEKRQGRVKTGSQDTMARLDRALSQRLFLIDTTADETTRGGHPQRMYRVLGSTGNIYTITISNSPGCDCPDSLKGNLCKHVMFVMCKVLRLPRNSPLVFQRSLMTSEVWAIFAWAAISGRGGAVVDQSVQASDAVREALSPNADNKKKKKKKKEKEEEEKQKAKSSQKDENAAARNIDEDCPICFDALRGGKVEACSACQNAVHQICMTQWKAHNQHAGGGARCPLCRGQFYAPKDDNKKGKENKEEGGRRGSVRVNSEGYMHVSTSLQPGILRRRDTSTYRRSSWNGFGEDDHRWW